MKLTRVLTTVDTHTAGGPTRILTAGLPPLRGESVAARMEHFRAHHDPVRKLLLNEPRGHRDMYGAVLTEPCHPDADLGVFFPTASGYLPSCVHSAIGVVTAGLETGFVQATDRPAGTIHMETPSGLVKLIPEVRDGRVASVSLRPAAGFVHTPSARLDVGDGLVLDVVIAFSGVFFVLVEVGQLGLPAGPSGTPLEPESAPRFVALGPRVLKAANEAFEVRHPDRPGAASIALAMFHQEVGGSHGRDIVIGPTGGVDRSPCGAGTAAKVVWLFTEGRLAAGAPYLNESFLGTRFVGRALEPARVGPHAGALPEIQGSAYVTGMHRFVLEDADPLPEGFSF
ncbi:MAG: proline racemase [Gemmatimonadetes bacterium]|nr:proline racemase [Gemmatimonadota bacterium]